MIIQASVKQSKIQATASNANSTSQPTVQSRQFETQPGFLFLTNSFTDEVVVVVVVVDEVVDEDEEEEEEEVAGVPFDVDAPKLTTLLGVTLLLPDNSVLCDF